VFGAVPDYVRYAPIDFDTQRLDEVLPPLGYDPKQRTFFILEGVTMYVVEAGNGATLDFIRQIPHRQPAWSTTTCCVR
jgi:O-methyltransferase involved in polyketide biosynthesis